MVWLEKAVGGRQSLRSEGGALATDSSLAAHWIVVQKEREFRGGVGSVLLGQ